ncbi:MAG: tRNA uridine-5-carboxymethylaminomethyl(34) synthesis GTPase MnmE, partial [Desulfovibrionaceae bacterium]|nr:tRNA uridine-5-carboxymethylaminomethyl(34) synthesis GTPase MnmE [Desulfovibrionaceae bacterium]
MTDSNIETIAAIATAPGLGGVGIVRISGPKAKTLLEAVFQPGNPKFKGFRPWMLHYGKIVDAEKHILDEALAVYMPGPRSFTGEDVAELHCHGGPAILQAVLEELFKHGARLARPGEFTRRAFMSGRIDLSQAEAVAEAIAAPGREALLAAQNKLHGGLSKATEELRARLLDLRASLTLAVDFPEEELDIVPQERLRGDLEFVLSKINSLLAAHKRMQTFREGALVVIAGQVNVGKSSLLNAMLGRNRAIVTPHPGTTRDFLEETLLLDGLPIRLVDTAGLRKTNNAAEQQGLDLARELFEQADMVLLLVDITRGPAQYELDLLAQLGPQKFIGVANKCDLAENRHNFWPYGETRPEFENLRQIEWTDVSAKFSEGIERLSENIRARLLSQAEQSGPSETGWNIAPNLRQAQVLEMARAEGEGILNELEQN